MATSTYKQVFAKTISSANTEESAYVVPAATMVVGQVFISNTGTSTKTYRFAVVSGGGSAAAKDWLKYDVTLNPGQTDCLSGLTLNAADELRVYSNATSTTAGTGVIFHGYGEVLT
jgi:hypothetical protein